MALNKLYDRVVKGAGYALTIKSGSLAGLLGIAIRQGLEEGSKVYLDRVLENVSLDDHTLAELRRLGHPYARGVKKAARVHSDDRLVHEQEGDLKRSLKTTSVLETSSKFSVYLTSDSDIITWVIHGTSRMRPRKFHELAYKASKEDIWEPIRSSLGNVKHKIRRT